MVTDHKSACDIENTRTSRGYKIHGKTKKEGSGGMKVYEFGVYISIFSDTHLPKSKKNLLIRIIAIINRFFSPSLRSSRNILVRGLAIVDGLRLPRLLGR
jgi:hypothetical protein